MLELFSAMYHKLIFSENGLNIPVLEPVMKLILSNYVLLTFINV